MPKLKTTIAKVWKDPEFYFKREFGFLTSLVPSQASEEPAPTSSEQFFSRLEAAFDARSLASYEDGRAYLVSVTEITALLRAAKNLATVAQASAFLVPSGQAPIDCGTTPVFQLFSRTRRASSVAIWVRHHREARSYRFNVYEHPPGIYRDRSPTSFLKAFFEEDQAQLMGNIERLVTESDFHFHAPIDFVFTWVNGADPGWRKMLLQYRAESEIDWDRYAESDELRYALRSVFFNAPWFRNVYVVSNCAPPSWLEVGGRVRWVDHSEIIPERFLPTFNSHVIEACLWDIEGLAEHFVYLNDDMFLGETCWPRSFFTSNDCSISYMESYGSVDGYVESSIPASMPWQHAAVNGARLIFERFGKRPTQHHRHVPYAMKRSVALRMVDEFPEAFEQVRGNRFRATNDLSPTSFLYHHYAFHLREAVRSQCRSQLVQKRNFGDIGSDILAGRTGEFFCLNDGADSHDDHAFQTFKTRVMKRLFPLAAPWEVD
jgi:hypothetical protein